MENINWLSIIISTFIPIIFGLVFYSPSLFGGIWMKTLKLKPEDFQKKKVGAILFISIILSFLLSFFLLQFTNSPGQEGPYDTFAHGAWHGAFVCLLAGLPILIINGLYELRSLLNLLINSVYWIICLSLMSGVLDAMNHWSNAMN